jgi:hypothetical protein
VLAKLQVYGVPANTSLARDWYPNAQEFGASETQERLKLL